MPPGRACRWVCTGTEARPRGLKRRAPCVRARARESAPSCARTCNGAPPLEARPGPLLRTRSRQVERGVAVGRRPREGRARRGGSPAPLVQDLGIGSEGGGGRHERRGRPGAVVRDSGVEQALCHRAAPPGRGLEASVAPGSRARAPSRASRLEVSSLGRVERERVGRAGHPRPSDGPEHLRAQGRRAAGSERQSAWARLGRRHGRGCTWLSGARAGRARGRAGRVGARSGAEDARAAPWPWPSGRGRRGGERLGQTERARRSPGRPLIGVPVKISDFF